MSKTKCYEIVRREKIAILLFDRGDKCQLSISDQEGGRLIDISRELFDLMKKELMAAEIEI